MNKAIFLDRDGTINVEKNYLFKIEEFEFLDGVVDGLKKLSDAGFLLIIVTNQSGIGRGYYTEDDYYQLRDYINGKLEEYNVKITAEYFCPHLIDAKIKKYAIECGCRKPKLGLFERAIEEFDIDVNASYAIGDKIRDLEIAKSCAKGFLVYDKEKKYNGENGIISIAGGIDEAADLILNNL